MKIVFMGTPQAAVPSLERLVADGHEVAAVYTQPDRPSGRGNKVTHSPVKQFAAERGLSIFQPERIKTPEASELFISHCADVAVVVAYGRILPATFLTAFPSGAVNVHFSLLPKYRGAAPVNWAIVNGEQETGVTTMQMDTGLDTGPILLHEQITIGRDETAIELMDRLAQLGARLLSRTLNEFGSIVPLPQDDSLASLAPMLRRDDGLIDWSMSASEIVNRIRGFQPFPTAFSFVHDRKITIWKASAGNDDDSRGEPGEVLELYGDTLLIRCGKGSILRVDELQPEGKRRMGVRDYLNGASITVGSTFGGPR